MKKLTTFLTSLLLLLAMQSHSQTVSVVHDAFDESDFGKSVEISIYAADVRSVIGDVNVITIRLEYDDRVLAYQGYTDLDPVLAPYLQSVSPAGGGAVQFNFLDNSFSGFECSEGLVVKLVFIFNGGASDLTLQTLEFLDMALESWDLGGGSTDNNFVFAENSSVSAFATLTSIAEGPWGNIDSWDGEFGALTQPGPGHNVTIAPGGTITIDNDAIANSVTIQPGGKLTQNSDELTITEDLLIQSTAAGTGSFIHKGTLEVGGNITVERFFGTAETWRLVSSPVANQAVSGSWIPSGDYPDGTGYDFYAWHEPSETWLNQKVPANAITAFVPGTGYLVSFEDPNLLKTFSGALNKGTVPVAVTREGSGQYAGSNLIGNPYASGIDWSQADRTLFEDNFAYVYDRNTDEHGTTEGYLPVDGSAPDAWIGAHQGFFVLVKDEAKTNFEFTEGMMAHGGAFTKEQPEWEQLILHLNNDTHYHQTTIRLNEASEFDRDRTDAIHFFSMNPAMPQIYSFTSDQAEVAINSIPYIDEEMPVDLGLYLPEAGTFTLSLRELSGRFTDLVPYLEDLGEDRMINLKSEGEYSFSAWQGTLINRFRLHLKSGDITTSIEEAEPNLNRMWFHDNKLFVDAAEILDVGVYDVSGRRLGSYRALAGQHVFPLQLAAGVYVVSLDGNTHRETLRIVVR